jgi:hypothetical protein
MESNREEGPGDGPGPGRDVGRGPERRSATDPDATLATDRTDRHAEPSYKQHTAVDDEAGVIVDVEVTTGKANEGRELSGQLERVERTTGSRPKRVTADGAYAHDANYAGCEGKGIEPVIPPRKRTARRRKKGRRGRVPVSRFKYDPRHEVVRCPRGKRLRRARRTRTGWRYRARPGDCRSCPLRRGCVPPTGVARELEIADGYDSRVRAARRRERGDPEWVEAYRRHRWRVEGVHGEAKTRHGLRRAARRGLANVRVQAYITAAVMNLKRLAAFILPPLGPCSAPSPAATTENPRHILNPPENRNIYSTTYHHRIAA